MSVLMTFRTKGDPALLEKRAGANPDGMRAIAEQAHSQLFVVDPYIDPDVINRYVRPLRAGVSIRLLTTKNRWIADVMTSCELLSTQRKQPIALRESADLHGRLIFIDGKRGFSRIAR